MNASEIIVGGYVLLRADVGGLGLHMFGPVTKATTKSVVRARPSRWSDRQWEAKPLADVVATFSTPEETEAALLAAETIYAENGGAESAAYAALGAARTAESEARSAYHLAKAERRALAYAAILPKTGAA